MEIFKNGRHGYVAISREFQKSTALAMANDYFKARKDALEIGIGNVEGDELTIRQRGGNVWVISRKEKNV
jgi:hypothetical protein